VGFLASVIVLLFVTLDTLVIPGLRVDREKGRKVFTALFGLWLLVYPTYSMYKYISASMVEGEISNYNYYNRRVYNENPAIPMFNELIAGHPEATFYSNYSDGMWFHTRHSTVLMPRTNPKMDMAEIRKNFSGWPGEKPGYILWFLPNEYKHVVPPRLLAEIADLQLVFANEHASIYSVQAKP
jgi:hypothetical protein